MRRPILIVIAGTAISGLTGCSTVTDMVTANVPDFREGRASIVVSLREQRAYLFKGSREVAATRISTGRKGYRTPTGRFKVIRKDADHRSNVYGYFADEDGRPVKEGVDIRKDRKPRGSHFVGASMPYYLEFKSSYGLHAGNLPGVPASHGCVRLPYWKARQFYNAARIGTPVTVKQ